MRLANFIRGPLVAGTLMRRNNTDLRIDYTVHLAIGQLDTVRLLPGEPAPNGTQYVQMVKAVSTETNQPVELSFGGSGEEVDGRTLLEEVGRRRFEKYGRLHPLLYDYISRPEAEPEVPIAVWVPLDSNLTNYAKPTEVIQGPLDAEVQALNRILAAREALSGRLRQLGASNVTSPDRIPIVYASLAVSQIRELAQADYIGLIHLDIRNGTDDLADSIKVARSDQVHALGYDGSGVRVAVFEPGPDDTTNLAIAGSFQTQPPGTSSQHARLTHAIIKNTEPNHPHGHAPGCTLYSANDYSDQALYWAVQSPQLSTVVSQSFHRFGEPQNAILQGDDIVKDWLALQYPYPTIVQAAGNYFDGDSDGIIPPSDEYVNHKGYNTISVGNHDDTATSITSTSVFRNPTTSHGDRELPDIAANGDAVSVVGLTMSGTSFSAPAVAGITALLQQVNTVLQFWPEGIRAILYASANRNFVGTTWWNDVSLRVDAAAGAGAADALRGALIAKSYQLPNNQATPCGWGIGTLTTADVDTLGFSTFKYNLKVPASKNGNTCKIKVALAWDSKVTSSGTTALSSVLTVDLDLIVRDSQGNWVAFSISWDNSAEIVEFDGVKGECYEIVIRRWSGTDNVWYGVAWTHL
ncbi:hypothetical protein CPB86DRAFT_790783 [Serendipita vermifera]|nr:hypothetical protein CPB86DRAFT_790783 [Serendipita vermifera]